jgi:carbonic anhydrase
VDDVARKNVLMTIDNILKDSPVLAEMNDHGDIMVKGAMYDIQTGKVTMID